MAKNSKSKPGRDKNNSSNKITTIKLDNKTKQRLEHLREHKETYNEVINKALNILNICLKKPLLANKILRDIERSRKRENLIENPDKILKKKDLEEQEYYEDEEVENIISPQPIQIKQQVPAKPTPNRIQTSDSRLIMQKRPTQNVMQRPIQHQNQQNPQHSQHNSPINNLQKPIPRDLKKIQDNRR
jgi:hypothetical protein